LQTAYPQYNQAIREIEDEHMLLNLVRLRYSETPVFLQIASITTSYNVNVNVSGSLTGVEDVGGAANPDSATISSGAGYSETPTISYSLPESREFFGRILAPLGADQVGVISQAGGGSLQLIALGVKKINGLENLNIYSDSLVHKPDSYDELMEAMELMVELERAGMIDYAYGFVSADASSPFAPLDARAIPEGEKIGLEFYTNEDGEYVAKYFTQRLHLRFSKRSGNSEKARRLRQLLRLAPDQFTFPITDADDASIEKKRIFSTDVAAAMDPDAEFREIVLQNRSMLEVMYYASMSIDVPEEHLEAGIVDPAEDALKGLLTIRSSKGRPDNAFIRVRYEGYWYYIAADDLRSRRTFVLLNALFAVTGGTVPGGKPVLTIPTG